MVLERDDYRGLSPKDRLRRLRDDWSDEIPTEILHSTSPNNKFKVRRNWFQEVVATLETVIGEMDEIDDDSFAVKDRVRDFVRYCTSDAFKEKPLTELSDIFEANRIINLVTGDKPDINADQLLKVQDEQARIALELREHINKTFVTNNFRRYMGKTLFGSETKRTENPNGTVQEEDWTQEDFDEEWKREGEEREKELRSDMARDLKLAIESLMDFFTMTEHPLVKTANTDVDLILALTDRFLASKVDVFEEWPTGFTEDRQQSRALEAVRQYILKPIGTFYEDIKVSEDAWDLRTDEMRLEKDMERWQELEQIRIEQRLKDREEDEWIKVVLRVDSHLTEYIKQLVTRTIKDGESTIDFASRLVKDGERVVSQQNIDQWQEEVGRISGFGQKLLPAYNLTQILALIKEEYGQEAGFGTFLETLNPTEPDLA